MAAAFWIILATVLVLTVGVAIIGFGLHLLWLFLVGLAWGFVGRMFVRDTRGMGLLATSLAGIAGSVSGGLVADHFDLGWLLQLLVSIVCAAVAVFLLRELRGGGSRRRQVD